LKGWVGYPILIQ